MFPALKTCDEKQLGSVQLTNIGPQILRATHKIADHSVRKHDTGKVDPFLIIAAVCTAINGALRINMSVLRICFSINKSSPFWIYQNCCRFWMGDAD
jgi:hypothetical protein